MRYHFGEYVLDADAYELRRRGEIIALEPKGFQVLLYLIQHHDRVVPRDELFAHCWPGTFVSDWALTRCLARIRKAIGDGRDGTRMIKTVHGQGYRFVAPLTVDAGAASSHLECAAVPPPAASVPDSTPVALPLAAPPGAPPLSGAVQLAPPAAERRVLTVLCCTLVDAHARQRDLEDVQALVQRYHTACAEVMDALGGTVAQYLPDAVVAYVGYPQAHDDDAQRGVRAGLRIITNFRTLAAAFPPGQVAARVGIHTGLAVVGELGGDRRALLAVGETPATAMRLAALAEPGMVVISAATARLVEGYFTWQALPTPTLAAQDAAHPAYQVLEERAVQSRFDVVMQRGLTPFVGRKAELSLLQARWAEAQDRAGQVVLLTGEPGIGKSRLVQILTAQVAAEPHVRLEWRCSPYAQYSPWHPVIAHLHRLLRWHQDEAPEAKLRTLETALAAVGLPLPEAVPLLAAPPIHRIRCRRSARSRKRWISCSPGYLRRLCSTRSSSSSRICTGATPPRWNCSPF
jgi:DNA-binding winged helix-turn-helix (wHTH) protein/class 3 adenylate cyclase